MQLNLDKYTLNLQAFHSLRSQAELEEAPLLKVMKTSSERPPLLPKT